jgi:hypothetical protein
MNYSSTVVLRIATADRYSMHDVDGSIEFIYYSATVQGAAGS